MSELRIQQLFEARVKLWADDQGIPVAFPNTSFKPPAAGMYIRAYLLPATPTSQTLETSTTFLGVFQMSLYAPRNLGAGPTGEIVAQLRALFPCDSALVADDGFKVAITSPLDVPAGLETDTSYLTPTSFTYRADVATT